MDLLHQAIAGFCKVAIEKEKEKKKKNNLRKQRFTWFSFRSMSTGGVYEKIS